MYKMDAMQTPQPKVSFKEQMHQAREDAILQSACRLLGEKAFDAMTMDDVANAVGIAKASLYKHFCSKEELCSAAMVQILGRVQTYLAGLPADMPPLEKLHALVRWSLERLLTNEMPLLPSRNSTLRAVLMANKDYLNGLVAVSDQIGEIVRVVLQTNIADAAGAAVPIVALERWLPLPDAGDEDTGAPRLLVLQHAGALVGVRVDAVLGVKPVATRAVRTVHHTPDDSELFESVVPASAAAPMLCILEVARLMRLAQAWCAAAELAPANCHDPGGTPWMMEDTGGVRASTGRGRSIL